MIEVTKSKSEFNGDNYYDFDINNGSSIFNIHFAGNLDLYWNIYGENHNNNEDKTFVIEKENYFLYSLFEELFIDLESLDIFDNTELEFRFCEDDAERQEVIERNKSRLEQHRQSDEYKSLYHDGIIEWHSDDYPYDKGSIVTIRRSNESFLITFQKSKEYEWSTKTTYAIRFRNTRSGYTPFNAIFMKMYHKLIEYEPDFHQIHIEEYLYMKKLKK